MGPEKRLNKDLRMFPFQTQPYLLHLEEGEKCFSFGSQVFVKATAIQTGGAFNLFEVFCQPGFTTPMHLHYVEDVAIYVLEGTLTFFWGSEKKEAVSGTYLFQPRCIPHGFRVDGGKPARILYLTIPAGLDRFVLEQNMPVSGSKPEIAAARYKIEILGPLPD